uniref:Col_cuticle_N domain-containing protein n=1 Tax=Rhabditophanes sp. KR3021 TaxID=114890 RepID=A0AC35TLT3_9BILA
MPKKCYSVNPIPCTYVYSEESYDFYKLVCHITATLSVVSTIILCFAAFAIFSLDSNARFEVEQRAEVFKFNSENTWMSIMQLQGIDANSGSVNPFLRFKRSQDYIVSKCAQCTRLICPGGKEGPQGLPGIDGHPGNPGSPGKAGIDGIDITMDLMPEMPCVVCPKGPKGVRGQQGERGIQGHNGLRGSPGKPGVPGNDGPHGNQGVNGIQGPKGVQGYHGKPGETVISGVGIKGAKGIPGVPGLHGENGITGRNSKVVGMPGDIGNKGPMGPTGQYGRRGDNGMPGMPGEPGQAQSYCPSDCGVSKILVPLHMTFPLSEGGNEHYDDADQEQVNPAEAGYNKL